jgi:hypothetical protein
MRQLRKLNFIFGIGALSGLALQVSLAGCAKTVAPQPGLIGKAMGETPALPPARGFLGSDYSLMKPGNEGQAALVYLNPAAQWKNYDKIMLEPVEFWDSADSKVSPPDQHMLTAYFYNQLKQALEAHFTLVDQAGPGTMTLQVAIINAESATPGLRSVSVAIPQARILNRIQSVATGSIAFAGSAEAEGRITNSQTGELLAASADRREGGMAISSAAQWKWGDAENVMNLWAGAIARRLNELHTGTTPHAD